MDQPTVDQAPRRRSQFALSGARVLIVAADVQNAGRAFMSLNNAGAQVRLIRRHDQLATFVDEASPDLILIDCQVPGCAAVIRQLRRNPETAQILIVGLQERLGGAQRARLRQSGIDELLPKPIEPRTFARRLVEAVSHARLHDEAPEAGSN